MAPPVALKRLHRHNTMRSRPRRLRRTVPSTGTRTPFCIRLRRLRTLAKSIVLLARPLLCIRPRRLQRQAMSILARMRRRTRRLRSGWEEVLLRRDKAREWNGPPSAQTRRLELSLRRFVLRQQEAGNSSRLIPPMVIGTCLAKARLVPLLAGLFSCQHTRQDRPKAHLRRRESVQMPKCTWTGERSCLACPGECRPHNRSRTGRCS